MTDETRANFVGTSTEALLFLAYQAMPDSQGMVGLREYDAFMDTVAGLTPKDVIRLLAPSERERALEAALKGMVRKWGSHSGSCCTFTRLRQVVVTPDSCKCSPVERAAHDVLDDWGRPDDIDAALAPDAQEAK